ncbi:MAG: YetF domain-containing protein [Gammaproteobacteria bacterium]
MGRAVRIEHTGARIDHSRHGGLLVSLSPLLAKLREEGIENIQVVKFACMESDGKVSVIKRR